MNDHKPEKPAYRYLEPLPTDPRGRAFIGLRWALVVALALWTVILLAGYLAFGALTQ